MVIDGQKRRGGTSDVAEPRLQLLMQQLFCEYVGAGGGRCARARREREARDTRADAGRGPVRQRLAARGEDRGDAPHNAAAPSIEDHRPPGAQDEAVALVSRHLPRLAPINTERLDLNQSRGGGVRPATAGGSGKCEWRACVQPESCQHEAMQVNHSLGSSRSAGFDIAGCRTPAWPPAPLNLRLLYLLWLGRLLCSIGDSEDRHQGVFRGSGTGHEERVE